MAIRSALVNVTEIARSVEFYSRFLGGELVGRLPDELAPEETRVELDGTGDLRDIDEGAADCHGSVRSLGSCRARAFLGVPRRFTGTGKRVPSRQHCRDAHPARQV